MNRNERTKHLLHVNHQGIKQITAFRQLPQKRSLPEIGTVPVVHENLEVLWELPIESRIESRRLLIPACPDKGEEHSAVVVRDAPVKQLQIDEDLCETP